MTVFARDFEVNPKYWIVFNNMRTHLDSLSGKMQMSYNKIRGILPFLSKDNRKTIINAKIRGQMNLTLPLIINQPQAFKKQVETLIMQINKWIYGGCTYR